MNSLNETPISARIHIAVFGRRNAGKSSLLNALAGQPVSLVSEVAGTTTDPVFKTMELLPLGPVVLIDTAGLDDAGLLGEMRVRRALEILERTDLAVLLIDGQEGVTGYETDLLAQIRKKGIAAVGAVNKTDAAGYSADSRREWENRLGLKLLEISAVSGKGMDALKEALIDNAPRGEQNPGLMCGLIRPGDLAVLVTPIDKAAPKGRLILPQQQVIRECLDHDAAVVVTKENTLREVLGNLGKEPALVVTDSQAFAAVAAAAPEDIPLTSFSILQARQKGDLSELVKGVRAVERLEAGDRVLIAEACTHHRQPGDIGTVKIPLWLRQKAGGEPVFEWCSGTGFPADLGRYKLVVHCGGCMLNRREILRRITKAKEEGVPVVNYGVLIAYLHGILPRVLSPLPEWKELVYFIKASTSSSVSAE
ncbi:MAG: [FeFe] hydrogenase H-cluster maturation GTPase HydF [Bacillota bacterium]